MASVAGGVGAVYGVMMEESGHRIDLKKDILPEDWVPESEIKKEDYEHPVI